MSITREQIRELAEFQDQNSCAVSFYFQPSTPRNKAHKEDTILIKDLAREAMRALEGALGQVAGQVYEGDKHAREMLEGLRERGDRPDAGAEATTGAIRDIRIRPLSK